MRWIMLILFLSSCTPVKTLPEYRYSLSQFDTFQATHPTHQVLLVSKPDASAMYATDAMIYTQKPYTTGTFTQHFWAAPPAQLIYPLIIQALQSTQGFKAVTSSPFSDRVDFRLDTQLLTMEQNFLKHPSYFHMRLKITLTDVKQNKVIASRLLNAEIPCTQNTPYGGVLAANLAIKRLTRKINLFTLAAVHTHKHAP